MRWTCLAVLGLANAVPFHLGFGHFGGRPDLYLIGLILAALAVHPRGLRRAVSVVNASVPAGDLLWSALLSLLMALVVEFALPAPASRLVVRGFLPALMLAFFYIQAGRDPRALLACLGVMCFADALWFVLGGSARPINLGPLTLRPYYLAVSEIIFVATVLLAAALVARHRRGESPGAVWRGATVIAGFNIAMTAITMAISATHVLPNTTGFLYYNGESRNLVVSAALLGYVSGVRGALAAVLGFAAIDLAAVVTIALTAGHVDRAAPSLIGDFWMLSAIVLAYGNWGRAFGPAAVKLRDRRRIAAISLACQWALVIVAVGAWLYGDGGTLRLLCLALFVAVAGLATVVAVSLYRQRARYAVVLSVRRLNAAVVATWVFIASAKAAAALVGVLLAAAVGGYALADLARAYGTQDLIAIGLGALVVLLALLWSAETLVRRFSRASADWAALRKVCRATVPVTLAVMNRLLRRSAPGNLHNS